MAAHDPAPEEFYDASDLAGLIYHNVLLENRIRRYPAFLSLAEQQEFQDLGNDAQFQNLWQSGPTLNDLLNYPKVKAMVNNPVMVANLKKIVGGNLKDLREFLEHGTSEKFKNEKILGRWLINTDASSAAYRRSRKDITPVLANATIAKMRRDYGGTVFIAGPDANMARLKVEAEAPGANPQQTLKATGTWSGENGSYSVSLTADDKTENSPIKLENDNRLSMTRAGFPLVFDREL